MAANHTMWAAGDSEKRQRISQEIQQLRRMSKSLRTRAMQSFIERHSKHQTGNRAEVRVEPASIAA
ncbi:MAG: hypothetical protein KIS73_17620 [Enhydrobacter sp.]|nr:hypothetical protein [Enhydrobacter sp.]